ncbi:39S ribosomal protein L10, mitochondrial-like [Ostrea edulis]|uniref:39S ribosomal protein L10, mitochondrial-like n=1 Tax=Ostrea edulis TaxID=37623 RepID=UPI0024AF7D41|nr:39S ribosomal protein L10, mitochondrial-like [Ostrea edulis]
MCKEAKTLATVLKMAALVKRISPPGWLHFKNWLLVSTRDIQKGNFKRRKTKLSSKRIFELVTEDILIVPPKPPKDVSCSKYKKINGMYDEEVSNPYFEFRNKLCQDFLARDENFFICHRNPVTAKTIYEYKLTMKEKGFRLHFGMTNNLLRKNIPGTKFEALAPYLASHNVLITSRNPEEADFRKLPAVLRKMPEFILLGGYIDGILLSREGITQYTKLPDKEISHSETAGILSLVAGGKTSSLLYSHAQTLGVNLKQYEKQLRGDEENDS